MTAPRFFVPPEWIKGEQVSLTDEVAHRLRNVLRMKQGESVIVLDGSGIEREVLLERVARNVAMGRVVEERRSPAEPFTRITLYQGVLKASRFEFALQKGVEVGISRFVPLIAERCVVSSVEDASGKVERWGSIVRQAAEQSHRGMLPTLEPATLFTQACQKARMSSALGLIPWEEEEEASLRDVLAAVERPGGAAEMNVALFVGPEGGFTREEVKMARGYGIRPVSLGPRTLRSETAGVIAAAIILYEMGDM